MSGELTITVLAEKMDLKKAMRIHFAGQAMAGFIASSNYGQDVCLGHFAQWSIEAADALIAELEKAEAAK